MAEANLLREILNELNRIEGVLLELNTNVSRIDDNVEIIRNK